MFERLKARFAGRLQEANESNDETVRASDATDGATDETMTEERDANEETAPVDETTAQGETNLSPALQVRDRIIAVLKTVFDPEIPVDIVELGLVYRVDIEPLGNGQRSVSVDMTLTAPGCGMGDILVQDAQEKIAVIPTVADARVQLVFDPPWNQTMMSDEARLQTGLM